jgi:hypothetical protein
MGKRDALKKIILGLLFLLLLSVIIAIIFRAAQLGVNTRVVEGQLTSTLTRLITEDGWYLYVDKEAGYSFSYPGDAHIQLGKNPNHPYNAVTIFFPIPDSYGYHGMVIDVVENTGKLSIEDFARSVYKSASPNAIVPDTLLSKAETITVAGRTALKVQIPPTLTDFIIFLPYQDKMFMINPSGDPFDTDDPAKGETLDLFYKVLATLTFRTGD